jgi:hypothetical protein
MHTYTWPGLLIEYWKCISWQPQSDLWEYLSLLTLQMWRESYYCSILTIGSADFYYNHDDSLWGWSIQGSNCQSVRGMPPFLLFFLSFSSSFSFHYPGLLQFLFINSWHQALFHMHSSIVLLSVVPYHATFAIFLILIHPFFLHLV